MTDKVPADWILIEAAKRSGIEGDVASLRRYYGYYTHTVHNSFGALCDMIERYEQPPVDRKLRCAREACLEQRSWVNPDETRQGTFDHHPHIGLCLRAIELWEEGFGK